MSNTPACRSWFGVHLAALMFAVSASAAAVCTAPEAVHSRPSLRMMANSRSMVWNSVVVDHGRILVAGPRWTGSKGPSVGIVQSGSVQPYPNASWNSWRPGTAPSRTFVNVNAIHRDDNGNIWIVDTGSPEFGGNPIPGGAKLVKIDLTTNRVSRIYPLGPDIALPGSYVDDVRTRGGYAYLTDAGRPGLIVLNIARGTLRRVLNGHASTIAPANRDIVLSGHVLQQADGKPLRVNADPLELSPDGRWLYYGPLTGPWSRIETRYLNDPALNEAALADHVEPWADLPPVGGTVMARDGSLYFSELASNAIRRRMPDGRIETIVQDPRLHWVDAPFLDDAQHLWLPVPQMDRSSVFQGADHGRSLPVKLYRIEVRLRTR